MKGVFIIGTDTGVGKTTVCAGILKSLYGSRKVAYWKPVQTGTIVGDDTKAAKSMSDLGEDAFIDTGYRFPEPLSPHVAAKRWGKQVELSELMKTFDAKQKEGVFLVIEGAGGVLVPFNEELLQIDFIIATKLPVLVVTEDRVGSINQTLLTVHELRSKNVEIMGVVLTRARRTLGNAEAIKQFGNVEILAEFDPIEDARSLVAQVGGHERLRQVFQLGKLPK